MPASDPGDFALVCPDPLCVDLEFSSLLCSMYHLPIIFCQRDLTVIQGENYCGQRKFEHAWSSQYDIISPLPLILPLSSNWIGHHSPKKFHLFFVKGLNVCLGGNWHIWLRGIFGSAGTFAHLYITQRGAKIFAQEPIHEKLNVYGLHFSFEIEIAFR